MASSFAYVFLLFGASICYSLSTAWPYTKQGSVSTEELVQRVTELGTIQRSQQLEILKHKQTIEQQRKDIEQQAKINEQQAEEITFLKDHIDEPPDIKPDTNTRFTEYGGDSDEASHSDSADDDEAVLPLSAYQGTLTRRQELYRRHKRQEGSVAFTVYLDHDVELGSLQTLKFNRIITNEGGGYSTHTGVFTCPTTGLYMLAFYVGERGNHMDCWMRLMINSQNVVDAAVDTAHDYQDLQGGNLVFKRLNQGDLVWVEVDHVGAHVEGSSVLDLTTFSGVLLLQ